MGSKYIWSHKFNITTTKNHTILYYTHLAVFGVIKFNVPVNFCSLI